MIIPPTDEELDELVVHLYTPDGRTALLQAAVDKGFTKAQRHVSGLIYLLEGFNRYDQTIAYVALLGEKAAAKYHHQNFYRIQEINSQREAIDTTILSLTQALKWAIEGLPDDFDPEEEDYERIAQRAIREGNDHLAKEMYLKCAAEEGFLLEKPEVAYQFLIAQGNQEEAIELIKRQINLRETATDFLCAAELEDLRRMPHRAERYRRIQELIASEVLS